MSTTPPYGFYERLHEAFPSQVIVDCTEVCNLACVHCPHPAFKRSSHYGARYLDPALNMRLVDEVRAAGAGITQYIRYTSEGEPLVHPQGYDMIEYAVRHAGVYVTLTTNGTIMNEKRTRLLLDAGVHMIDISIDAFTPATYGAIRVNGDLDVTRTNVERLLRWVHNSGATTKVVVSFIEQPRNRGEAADFERYWREQGAHNVVIRRMHSGAGAVAELADELAAQNVGEPRRPCLYPWERIVLNPRGFLAFCPQDWVHGSELADFRTTSIADVWRGAAYRALREAHLANDYACHGFCGACPDWKQTRWPGHGRSYADMIEDFRQETAR